jgi:hypothetical protein
MPVDMAVMKKSIRVLICLCVDVFLR